jgi:RNA polymerase sigma-70 factor (ECF subfamily)
MVTNFHELYQKYAQDIYRFAFWLCGNAQDAEDITSETFILALTSASQIKTETVKGYLLTIAKNLAYKKSNQSKRFDPIETKHADLKIGPAQIAEISDSLQSAMRFIQTLPEIDRAALILRLQDELPYDEIARILNISLSTAKVKVHRTRLKLSEYMYQQEEQ